MKASYLHEMMREMFHMPKHFQKNKLKARTCWYTENCKATTQIAINIDAEAARALHATYGNRGIRH